MSGVLLEFDGSNVLYSRSGEIASGKSLYRFSGARPVKEPAPAEGKEAEIPVCLARRPAKGRFGRSLPKAFRLP